MNQESVPLRDEVVAPSAIDVPEGGDSALEREDIRDEVLQRIRHQKTSLRRTRYMTVVSVLVGFVAMAQVSWNFEDIGFIGMLFVSQAFAMCLILFVEEGESRRRLAALLAELRELPGAGIE